MSDYPPSRDWDPSEVIGGPRGADPRSPWWRAAEQYGGYDRGLMDDAQRFHEDRGYWPPGTGMRMREDEEQDRYGRARDSHPGARGIHLAIRQQLHGMRLSGSLLDEGLDVRYLAEEAAYMISFHVLREDLPPVTAGVERTVRVTILQVSPATWWDHFKLTYRHWWWLQFLTWLRVCRPARTVDRPQSRYIKVRAAFDLDRYRLYPRASADLVRRLGEPVVFAVPRPVRFTDWTGDDGVDIDI